MQIWVNSEGAVEDVGIFYGNLVFLLIGIFSPFWYVAPSKTGQNWYLLVGAFAVYFSTRSSYVISFFTSLVFSFGIYNNSVSNCNTEETLK
jgi:hypothetical protein